MSPEPDSKTLPDGLLASLKKVEEAGNSRFFEAAAWVKSMVGSLDIPCDPPSEEEFRLCLRNGIILCNLLNKVQPGAVSNVVANHVSAYQYFANVTNFLAAVVHVKLPTFEASLLEQETSQPGSTTKIVDCILALKDYYQSKQQFGENAGPLTTPMVPRKTGNLTPNCVPVTLPNRSVRNMQDDGGEERLDGIFQSNALIGAWLKQVAVEITSDKENTSCCTAWLDAITHEAIQAAAPHGSTQTLMNLIIAIIAENKQTKVSQDQDNQLFSDCPDQKNGYCSPFQSQDPKPLVTTQKHQHQMRLDAHRKEVSDIRDLLHRAREDVHVLQFEWRRQFELLDNQVRGICSAASGYHRVLEENKILYNSVQDLKGSIRLDSF